MINNVRDIAIIRREKNETREKYLKRLVNSISQACECYI